MHVLNSPRTSLVLALVVVIITPLFLSGTSLLSIAEAAYTSDTPSATRTPIKHLIVIFQENISFDHYFATYPHATNPSGEPQFHASPNTPSINNLTGSLLNNNTNLPAISF